MERFARAGLVGSDGVGSGGDVAHVLAALDVAESLDVREHRAGIDSDERASAARVR